MMLTREQHKELWELFLAYGSHSHAEGVHYADAEERARKRAQADADVGRFSRLLDQVTDMSTPYPARQGQT